MPEATESAPKPELKSFEDAAAAFMEQAQKNEYGEGDDAPASDQSFKFKESEKPAEKPAEAASEKPAEKPSDSRRAPESLFKKEEAKPEDEKPSESEIDKIEAPEFKDPAKAGQWDSLKSKAKEWEKKAHEFEQRLSKMSNVERSNDDFQKQLADRDVRIKEMSALVERANVEAHPDFRKKYVEGRDALVGRAKTIVSDAGGEGDDIALALSLSGRARVEAIEKAAENLSPFQNQRLGRVIDELEALDSEAATKREKSSEAWKEIQQEQHEQQQRQREEFSVKALKTYDSVKREMARELEVLREAPSSDWWNEQRKAIVEKSDKFFAENEDMAESAKAAIWKEAGPVYKELYDGERKYNETEITRLTAELAETKKALSEAYGSGPGAAARIIGDGAKTKANMTFEERVAAEMGE